MAQCHEFRYLEGFLVRGFLKIQILSNRNERLFFIYESTLRPYSSRKDRQQILGRYFLFASIYAWGVPFVIVLVGQILDNTINQPSHVVVPQFGVLHCWFFGK